MNTFTYGGKRFIAEPVETQGSWGLYIMEGFPSVSQWVHADHVNAGSGRASWGTPSPTFIAEGVELEAKILSSLPCAALFKRSTPKAGERSLVWVHVADVPAWVIAAELEAQ